MPPLQNTSTTLEYPDYLDYESSDDTLDQFYPEKPRDFSMIEKDKNLKIYLEEAKLYSLAQILSFENTSALIAIEIHGLSNDVPNQSLTIDVNLCENNSTNIILAVRDIWMVTLKGISTSGKNNIHRAAKKFDATTLHYKNSCLQQRCFAY